MDSQHGTLVNWAYFLQGKSMEELRQFLLLTNLELEQTRLAVQEEMKKRDAQLIHLRDLLDKAVRERDEANEKCQRLLLEKVLLLQQQQQTPPASGISGIEDEARRGGIDSNNGLSSSDCEESIVSSPNHDPVQNPQMGSPATVELVPDKLLPEKGKLLQAVMKAGPLLQTLLLAGPLPQWRHPPPPLEAVEIPPVTIPSSPPAQLFQDFSVGANGCDTLTNCGINGKRALSEAPDATTEANYPGRALL